MFSLWALSHLAVARTLDRVVFPSDFAQDHSAYCLDGSAAGYYVDEVPDSQGWVIYLEGGGLCVTRFDCEARKKGGEGSSTKWPATFSDTTNVLAGHQDANPFANFSAVWVPYCSGDTWTGTQLHNQHLGGLATCGHNIVRALLHHLRNTTATFGTARQLLLSGGSAGGIGVFHNIDFVADELERLGMRTAVRGTPQAGYFFPRGVCNFETFALGSRAPFDFFAAGYVKWLEGGYVNEACAAAVTPPSRCWDVSVAAEYLKTPLFIAQNAVDQNQAADELLCPCSAHSKVRVVDEWMQDYANKSRASMASYLAGHATSAVFMPACYDHTASSLLLPPPGRAPHPSAQSDLCMKLGPTIRTAAYPQGITYREALRDWYFNGAHRGELIIEHCDPAQGATCNAACGGGCGDS